MKFLIIVAFIAVMVLIYWIATRTFTSNSTCTHDCEQGRKCTCGKNDLTKDIQ